MKDRLIHQIGATVSGDDINKHADKAVDRIAGRDFVVRIGSSCAGCSFTGLGHSTCLAVQCSRYDRDDGIAVIYDEVHDAD